MPAFLITIGKAILGLPTWAKVAIGLMILAGTIFGYMWWQSRKIKQLEGELNQSQVNRAMDGVNALTNKIEEEKRLDANLTNNTNNAVRDSGAISNRDSGTYTGTNSELRFCERYCWDSSCHDYRLVHECR